MIQPGREWHKYKEQIIKATQYLALSEVFGWTPKQIDALDEDDKMQYIALLKGRGMAKPKE